VAEPVLRPDHPDFALLTVMIIVFFVGAYISFLHYDVR